MLPMIKQHEANPNYFLNILITEKGDGAILEDDGLQNIQHRLHDESRLKCKADMPLLKLFA